MKFVINFGIGTFHQLGCKHVNAEVVPTINIDYAEVRELLRHPYCYSKACSYCLPLLRLESSKKEISEKARGKAMVVQDSFVPVREEDEIKLELGLTLLQERLRA